LAPSVNTVFDRSTRLEAFDQEHRPAGSGESHGSARAAYAAAKDDHVIIGIKGNAIHRRTFC
jgi:hypothetical protein